MAYKFEDCEYCANHGNDPTVCDECNDAEEFEPYEEDMAAKAEPIQFYERKVA